LVLAFDTSAAHCAAALVLGDRVLADVVEPMQKGQAERLVPLLEEVLARAGMAWGNLDTLAVGVGPGNFTGIRIAVSTARGLALGLGIPAIGVSRFDALAHDLMPPFAVVEDARRGSVYVQVFGAKGGAPHLLPVDEAASLIGNATVIGTGASLIGRESLPMQDGALPIAQVAQGRVGQDLPRPAPFYLRSADATPPSDPPPVMLDA
jgi:tRNA threonylcarbamoyl adenosine modification protein YeaZ